MTIWFGPSARVSLHVLFAIRSFVVRYLSFHQLFGPFGIMISDIVVDLARFWVLFSLFWLGFSFSLSTLYEAYIPADPAKVYDGAIIMNMVCYTVTLGDSTHAVTEPSDVSQVVDPFTAAQLLYWAIFGLIDPFGQIPKPELSPPFALQVILIVYGIYLTATMIGEISQVVDLWRVYGSTTENPWMIWRKFSLSLAGNMCHLR